MTKPEIPPNMLPEEIEKRSFEMIESEGDFTGIPPENKAVVKRVIHTTADFDYAQNLCFSQGAVQAGIDALRGGCSIITDTQMAKSGINKRAAAKLGCEVCCYIGDEDVAEQAKRQGITRSRAAVDKAASLWPEGIYAVGNAPTALIRLYELIREEKIRPRLIIGVPVGFVHVVESKELIMDCGVPYIVARGRKGGSNVAAAIGNALLYQIVN